MQLGFNTMAMVQPTEPEHLIALIKECNAELDNLLEHLANVENACEKNSPKPHKPK
jgi:hypothetical protein